MFDTIWTSNEVMLRALQPTIHYWLKLSTHTLKHQNYIIIKLYSNLNKQLNFNQFI